jgi:hypothetical protein
MVGRRFVFGSYDVLVALRAALSCAIYIEDTFLYRPAALLC